MISKDKQYRTRDGRDVRIYAMDGAEPYPVHGAIKNDEGWVRSAWTKEGLVLIVSKEFETDLIEVKPRIKRTVLLNVYERSVVGWACKEKADGAGVGRLACVKVEIDCEEGEGL